MKFRGKLGLVLVSHDGRIVVHQRTKERIAKEGIKCNPHIGDTLVCISKSKVHESTPFAEVINKIRNGLKRKTPLEVTFVRNKRFSVHYIKEDRFNYDNHVLSCEIDILPLRQESRK